MEKLRIKKKKIKNKYPFLLQNSKYLHRNFKYYRQRKSICIFCNAEKCNLFENWYSKIDNKEKELNKNL